MKIGLDQKETLQQTAQINKKLDEFNKQITTARQGK